MEYETRAECKRAAGELVGECFLLESWSKEDGWLPIQEDDEDDDWICIDEELRDASMPRYRIRVLKLDLNPVDTIKKQSRGGKLYCPGTFKMDLKKLGSWRRRVTYSPFSGADDIIIVTWQ